MRSHAGPWERNILPRQTVNNVIFPDASPLSGTFVTIQLKNKIFAGMIQNP